ncbi:mediator of RNA polymerase II transcription subunit 4 [Aplysia californica]|uniref:Mediator of RNA polymerase II transcription subunit 4 n=1 Tax=Aplysia californica TaxID=6500 RepID=A0ABM0K0X6_APLCA|nr:mediator of RNA polymerase II transcription subunit 4 [Aplysia californica]
MASESSTRQRIHGVIDDLEVISKELIEQVALPKSQKKVDAPDTADLMSLLIGKDHELKELIKTAEEQEKVQKVIDALKAEVTKRDNEIRQLQRALKEAETIMATAVYQARQKLAAVRQAKVNKVPSEDLIKYAHRISASNAVAAPPTWGPGDPRRPYPTDLEMRHSFIAMGTFPEASSSTPTTGPGSLTRLYSQEAQPASHHHHHPSTPQQSSLAHHHHQPPHHHPSSQSQQPSSASSSQGLPPPFSWQPSQENPVTLGSHGLGDSLKGHSKEEDDVELMSTESSSSSSSDE